MSEGYLSFLYLSKLDGIESAKMYTFSSAVFLAKSF